MTDTLLPINATKQERDIEATMSRISDVPVPVRDMWSPDECPPEVLPWLGWQFSVDAWSADWSDAQKRQAIKDSFFVHKHKGTIGAVKSALASLGFDARIQEWFNRTPVGAPYTFTLLIDVNQEGATQVSFQNLMEVVARSKNLRSHLEDIEMTVTTVAGPRLGVIACIGQQITLSNFEAPFMVLNPNALVLS